METDAIEHCIEVAKASNANDICAGLNAADELAAIKAELATLRKDKARLDWLADRENKIGNVTLPTAIVERTLILRDAIDLAMAMKN